MSLRAKRSNLMVVGLPRRPTKVGTPRNDKNMKKVFKNEKETLAFAEHFAKKLRGGEVVALIGELGAGKTVFTKGLARGLGIRKRVQSPTFLLMKIYNVRTSTGGGHKIKYLCHVDAYRLSGAAGLVDIGLLDWLGRPDTVTVIEWANKVAALLRNKKVIRINFKLGKKEEERKVAISK
jgi:tRNA threonylcarbamoyladenosine biosynthesis protein TsaE